MARNQGFTRLNPAYLASRHAGKLFMLLALGLLAGLVWRALVQPTRYRAEAEVAVAVTPEETAGRFDWDEKLAEWRSILRDGDAMGLLGGNLRHALKLAATLDVPLDTSLLGERLAEFNPDVVYSASLYSNGLAARLAPAITVTRRDIASNLDFQSLAAIISDLDPPHDATGWDFSFFRDTPIIAARDNMIVRPGPDDRYFRVFYHLHRIQNGGRSALSPVAAWRTAVDELASRLDREARFAGGGGFGHTAKRELIRELVAIPTLAANSLYHANGWFDGYGEEGDHDYDTWRRRWLQNVSLDLQRQSAGYGIAAASMEMELYPLGFPRDTILTRLPPMSVAALLSFMAAREEKSGRVDIVAVVAPALNAAGLLPELPVQTPEAKPAPGAAISSTYREVIDEAAAQSQREKVATLTEQAKQARLDYGAAMLRLETARNAEKRLSREAVAARSRADRLWDRREDAELRSAGDTTPKVPTETAALFASRDELLRRIGTLLETCTEEHPFVKETRRQLAAVEAVLATHTPDPAADKGAEVRATRLAALTVEWESASAEADNLEERLSRHGEAVSCLLEEVAKLDRRIAEREEELQRAKALTPPIIRVEVPAEKPTPVPEPVPVPIAVPKPEPLVTETPHLLFEAVPSQIPLRRFPPSWAAPLWGMGGGLVVGILWMILGEIFARRFRNAAEARRLVGLPVLAALPAYDARSLRVAAGTIKGELARSHFGRLQFIPAPVEYTEPLPAVRRGKILPAKHRPRVLAWALGLAFLFLAGFVYYKSQTGFARPGVNFRGELPLPATTVRIWADEGEVTESWGDLP